MYLKALVLLSFFLPLGQFAHAQKIFAEGTIVYKVTLTSGDQKEFTGLYTFTFKGSQIKKELKLSNGYQDVEILNCGAGTVYALQTRNNRKYAIQLSMPEMLKKQAQFAGFTIKGEERNSRNFSGYAGDKGQIYYKDGTISEVYYRDWCPSQSITFERFPDAKFFPLYFSYKDEHGIAMKFEISGMEAGPVENSVFRIPPDYKMISNAEYRELTK